MTPLLPAACPECVLVVVVACAVCVSVWGNKAEGGRVRLLGGRVVGLAEALLA